MRFFARSKSQRKPRLFLPKLTDELSGPSEPFVQLYGPTNCEWRLIRGHVSLCREHGCIRLHPPSEIGPNGFSISPTTEQALLRTLCDYSPNTGAGRSSDDSVPDIHSGNSTENHAQQTFDYPDSTTGTQAKPDNS